jgi:heptosyltransferase-3
MPTARVTTRLQRHAPQVSERGDTKLHKIDRYLGIPFLFALSLFKSRRPEFERRRVTRIGVMLLGAIGDAILFSATIVDLRRAFPDAHITGFVSEGNQAIDSIIAGFDDTVLVPVKRPFVALSAIRHRPLDLLIDSGQWSRTSAILAACSGAGFTIGFRTPNQWRHLAFDAVADHSDQRHEIDNFRNLVAALGIRSNAMPRLRRDISSFRLAAGTRWIVFHPWPSGYRSALREWPEERWQALAAEMLGQGYGLVITGGPADQVRAERLAAAIGAMDGRVVATAGRASLADTVAILEQAEAVVSVNTGVMHMAAALDKPLVALHGPTNSRRWGPVNGRAIVLGPGPEHGGGYLHLGHEYPSNPPDCMDRITVQEVLDALRLCLAPDPAAASTTPQSPSLRFSRDMRTGEDMRLAHR